MAKLKRFARLNSPSFTAAAQSPAAEPAVASKPRTRHPHPSSLGYAHPYYWAPFVLIGNYQ